MSGIENLMAMNISPGRPPSPAASRAVAPAPVVRPRPAPKASAVRRSLQQQQAEELRELVDGLNVIARNVRTNLKFRIFEETGKYFVQVVNAESGEVIKSIPPVELLETLARISAAVGLIVDAQG